MAESAQECKDRMIRQLNSDAAIALRDEVFWTREMQYAETQAIADQMQEHIDVIAARKEWLTAAAIALEDVNTGL